MTKTVRWGILGASSFARKQMVAALQAGRGGTLAALATSDPAKAAGFAALAPGLRVHQSYDSLLADPEVDAIYVPLPNHLHVEWATRAAEAGKHVLCEKPIAMTAAQIDPLIALRDRTGLLIAEAFMIVQHPQWIKARSLCREGALGQVRRVSCSFSYNNPDPANVRNRQNTGGGGLRDIGVYIFGATRFVTGEEPEQILSTRIDWDGDLDTTAEMTARFPSFQFSGMVSMRLAPYQEMVFHGDAAVMKLTAPFNAGTYGEAQVELLEEGFAARLWRYPAINQYLIQIEAFNDAVLNGTEYPCPLEFSRGTQAMMDMVFAAAR